MFDFVMQSPIVFVFTVTLSWVCLRILSSRVLLSDLDSLGFLNIIVAISYGALACFYSAGIAPFSAVLDVGIITLVFFLGILISSLAFTYQNRHYNSAKIFNPTGVDFCLLTLLGILLLSLNAFFAWILLSTGTTADDRIVIAREFRALDVFRNGLACIFPYYSIGCYTEKKSKPLILLIALVAVSTFFTGSKSFIVPYFSAYCSFEVLAGRRQSILKLAGLSTAVFATAALIPIFWGLDTFVALRAIADRIILSADSYYQSYAAGDLTKLYGYYDPLAYIMHPFTSIFGVRGYDMPIGVMLFGQITNNYEGYGPNPFFPTLSMVLSNGNMFIAASAALVTGILIGVMRSYALKALHQDKFPNFFKYGIFSILFGAAPNIFIDIGIFEHSLIGVIPVICVMAGFHFVLESSRKQPEPTI